VATCPPSTEDQLIDLLTTELQLPPAVYKIRQLIYTTNKGPVLTQAIFPDSYTADQIEQEYNTFISTRLIQAVKETEFVTLYAMVTGDQLKFDINMYDYFYKKLTFDVIAVYDALIKYHSKDLRTMVAEINRYTDPIHTKVLLENVFNPVSKIWGFSAIATLYCMYIRLVEGVK